MGVTSIVLAGGKNLRLGRNKTLETICGKTLIERVIERLRLITSRILVVTSQEQPVFAFTGEIEVLADIYPGKGPIGGIYTGLLASPSLYSVVVACDMPFLNTELLSYMIELSPGFDAVVPRLEEGMLEPLCAVYSRSCLGVMKAELEHNHLQIRQSLSRLRVRYIERAELQEIDPQFLSFFNINRQSDIDKAITLITENGHLIGETGMGHTPSSSPLNQ